MKKIKIKMVEGSSDPADCFNFETALNKAIATIGSDKIIDIKYARLDMLQSAMIIYDDNSLKLNE